MKDPIMMDKKPANPMVKFAVPALVALVVVLGASSIYFFVQFNNLRRDPQQLAQQEVQKLVSRVGKLVVLPEGETPTVATVADPEKLKDQSFFANAKKGDRVLIYTNARKAILYDPVANKVIEIAPINIGSTQPQE